MVRATDRDGFTPLHPNGVIPTLPQFFDHIHPDHEVKTK